MGRRRKIFRTVVALATATTSLSVQGFADPSGKPFVVGIVVGSGTAPAIEGLSEIKSLFARTLGKSVEVMAARDYEALISAHATGHIDYALYSAQAYAAAVSRCDCVAAISVPLAENGAAGIRSILIVRRGKDPAAIALGSDDSLSGRLVPLAAWPDADRAKENGSFVVTPSVEDAEAMFVSGEVDAFFGWVPVLIDGAHIPGSGTPWRLAGSGVDPEMYDITWQSDTVLHGPHAVRSDLDPRTRAKLVDMLTDESGSEANALRLLNRSYEGGFSMIPNDGYRVTIDAITQLGRDH